MRDFCRVAWVSQPCRELWEPRIRRASAVLFDLQWQSVAEMLRDGCKLVVSSQDHFRCLQSKLLAHGLRIEIVRELPVSGFHTSGEKSDSVNTANYLVAIARGDQVRRLSQAMYDGDLDQELALLGGKSCCHEAFSSMWREERLLDFTWSLATRTSGKPSNEALIEMNCNPLLNPLWKWIGIRLHHYVPCSFYCENASKDAASFVELGKRLGYNEELDWVIEILSWPVEWSSLHGIAEILTPICKLVVRTDVRDQKHTVRLLGPNYPAEGAKGLAFPYKCKNVRARN